MGHSPASGGLRACGSPKASLYRLWLRSAAFPHDEVEAQIHNLPALG